MKMKNWFNTLIACLLTTRLFAISGLFHFEATRLPELTLVADSRPIYGTMVERTGYGKNGVRDGLVANKASMLFSRVSGLDGGCVRLDCITFNGLLSGISVSSDYSVSLGKTDI